MTNTMLVKVVGTNTSCGCYDCPHDIAVVVLPNGKEDIVAGGGFSVGDELLVGVDEDGELELLRNKTLLDK